MGLFDSVHVTCPDCGDDVEFQTKQGECVLASYRNPKIPINIALALDGETERCHNCGRTLEIRMKPDVPTYTEVDVK